MTQFISSCDESAAARTLVRSSLVQGVASLVYLELSDESVLLTTSLAHVQLPPCSYYEKQRLLLS